MIIVGLTGSIGMGKSTTATMFGKAGAYIYDADKVVHDLYAHEAVPVIGDVFPHVLSDGKVDRVRLSQHIMQNPQDLKKLEELVHPLVRQKEMAARNEAKAGGYRIIVLDVPLLFETGGEKRVDKVVVVSADASVQRERVLARDGMSEEKFAALLAKQLPDAKKRAMADYIIDTSHGLESAREQVHQVMEELQLLSDKKGDENK